MPVFISCYMCADDIRAIIHSSQPDGFTSNWHTAGKGLTFNLPTKPVRHTPHKGPTGEWMGLTHSSWQPFSPHRHNGYVWTLSAHGHKPQTTLRLQLQQQEPRWHRHRLLCRLRYINATLSYGFRHSTIHPLHLILHISRFQIGSPYNIPASHNLVNLESNKGVHQ